MIVSLCILTGISVALLPTCLSNFRAIEKVSTPISRRWDFTRSCGKTSDPLVNWGPGFSQCRVCSATCSALVQSRCHQNTSWPRDTIWRHRTALVFDHAMVFCQTAPSLYLNQCWLIINKAKWHSLEGSFYMRYHGYQLLRLVWNISFTSPWVHSSVLGPVYIQNVNVAINSLRPSNANMRRQSNHHWFR